MKSNKLRLKALRISYRKYDKRTQNRSETITKLGAILDENCCKNGEEKHRQTNLTWTSPRALKEFPKLNPKRWAALFWQTSFPPSSPVAARWGSCGVGMDCPRHLRACCHSTNWWARHSSQVILHYTQLFLECCRWSPVGTAHQATQRRDQWEYRCSGHFQ